MPGFLPFAEATFMLDFIVLAMMVILPTHLWSVWQVRVAKNIKTHVRCQLVLSTLLIVAVVAFAIEIRVFGWQHLTADSPYVATTLTPVLLVHRFFSISTAILWLFTLLIAWLMYRPTGHALPLRGWHRVLGRVTTLALICTCLTGWFFYWLAFVAGRS